MISFSAFFVFRKSSKQVLQYCAVNNNVDEARRTNGYERCQITPGPSQKKYIFWHLFPCHFLH